LETAGSQSGVHEGIQTKSHVVLVTCFKKFYRWLRVAKNKKHKMETSLRLTTEFVEELSVYRKKIFLKGRKEIFAFLESYAGMIGS
jgi:hypothetical protein